MLTGVKISVVLSLHFIYACFC